MKISELGLAGTLSGAEVLPIVQSGTTKKVSIDDVVALAGGGGTNPTYNILPFNNAGTFADSFLYNDTTILKTIYGSVDVGLYIDYDLHRYNFGDFNGNSIGISLCINEYGYLYTTGGNNIKGIKLDFGNLNYYFGACDVDNQTNLVVNDFEGYIKTSYQNNLNGLLLNFASREYNFGSVGGNNQTIFQINDNQQFIKTSESGNTNGLYFDFVNRNYQIGSFGNGNNLNLIIDDSNQIITATNGSDNGLFINTGNAFYQLGNYGYDDYITFEAGVFFIIKSSSSLHFFTTGNSGFDASGAISKIGDVDGQNNSTTFGIDDANETLIGTGNLTVGGSHTNSGQHLKINLGGTDYVIQLLNP